MNIKTATPIEESPLQELIDRIKSLNEKGHDDAGLRTCLQIATELLTKEKETHKAIADKAFDTGMARGHEDYSKGYNSNPPPSKEEYLNQF